MAGRGGQKFGNALTALRIIGWPQLSRVAELLVSNCGLKRIDKPDSVMASTSGHSDHSSSPLIAQGFQRPYPRAMGGPPDPPIWPCTRWGLPSVRHHWRTGELLPRLFNLTRRRSGWRYVFCGTFPRSLGAVVNGHPVLWSPDFPPPLARRRSLDPL